MFTLATQGVAGSNASRECRDDGDPPRALAERVSTMDDLVDDYMPMQSNMNGLLAIWKLGGRESNQGSDTNLMQDGGVNPRT